MALDRGDFDITLAAAAGNDPALLAELHADFLASLLRQVDLLGRARCDGNWRMAATRLHGLGASFHAPRLEMLATEALSGAPGEPAVLRKLQCLCKELAADHC